MTPGIEIVGAYEHPGRVIPHKSTAQVLAESVSGALRDAGLQHDDIDGYFGDTIIGKGPVSVTEYLGLDRLRYVDTTDTGGSTYLLQVQHAVVALSLGLCNVAMIAMAGLGRSGPLPGAGYVPEDGFETPFGPTQVAMYALAAQRHMYEYGTTSEQLAEIRVAASHHAQHNPLAHYRDVVTVEDVLSSPLISDPLHRLDCCVTTDGGGALILTRSEIARDLARPGVRVAGHGVALKNLNRGRIDLTHTGAVWSGPQAFERARIRPEDVDYASIYDSFTITVLMTIEDLGFCERGRGGAFVSDMGLVAPDGRLPVNTDGGGLANNHPGRRGGMPRTIEAVRQLRGEAHPAVQVPDCEIALVHGTGGSIASRHVSATLVLIR